MKNTIDFAAVTHNIDLLLKMSVFQCNVLENLPRAIDVRGPYVTPELNNELQCNVGNMWEKLPCIYMH